MTSNVRQKINQMRLGLRIKRARHQYEEDGLPLIKTQLAAKMRIGEQAVRRWEAGETAIPIEKLQKLAQVLRIPYPEQVYWLGLRGAIPKTRLPSSDQIV